MRHKLYRAISKVQDNAVLSGDVELDSSYTSINLKGTSHLKICIVAAIDEHDQMLFKISGLGRESFKILDQYKTSAGISGLDRIQEETEIHTGHEKVEA